MTLQQLKYVTTVAQTGTISDAAKKLFISQPSLTKAVRELEKEMEITIFERTNRGIVISKEGETFLGYARQVLEQAALLEETYKKKSRAETGVLCFHPALFVCSQCICGTDRAVWKRKV